jgi:tetratricopeptide (TPR) repeat protein
MEAIEDELKIDPQNEEARNRIGLVYYIQNRYDEAIKAFEEAIKIDRDNASAWNNLGFTFYAQGRYYEALQAFETAIKINPDFRYALFGRNASNDALERSKQKSP